MEQFSVVIRAYALGKCDRVTNLDEDVMRIELKNISNDAFGFLTDLEGLDQHLEDSKENVDSKIDDQENIIQLELLKDLKDWRNTETTITTEEQHHRERTIFKEVIITCEKLGKEINKTSSSLTPACR